MLKTRPHSQLKRGTVLASSDTTQRRNTDRPKPLGAVVDGGPGRNLCRVRTPRASPVEKRTGGLVWEKTVKLVRNEEDGSGLAGCQPLMESDLARTSKGRKNLMGGCLYGQGQRDCAEEEEQPQGRMTNTSDLTPKCAAGLKTLKSEPIRRKLRSGSTKPIRR